MALTGSVLGGVKQARKSAGDYITEQKCPHCAFSITGELQARSHEVANRVVALANCVLGATPEPDQTVGQLAGGGSLNDVAEASMRARDALDAALEAIGRLERALP